ncbi:mitogen-activated protein kinase kinase kinase [Martiniozyma asiatica (nom. inval.)]|nr:mitogen-activated protein kinase kinase kinase [Martiniozyma asiatica]
MSEKHPPSSLRLKLQQTPVLLSPKGTPMASPAATPHLSFDFSSSSKNSPEKPTHLDNILNEVPSPTPNPNTFYSPSSDNPPFAFPKVSRLPSSNAMLNGNVSGSVGVGVGGNGNTTQKTHVSSSQQRVQRSPAHKHSKVKAAVRPHTTILENNFRTKAPQRYQQQEQNYLDSITNYRNRYKINGDYYDNTINTTDDDFHFQKGDDDKSDYTSDGNSQGDDDYAVNDRDISINKSRLISLKYSFDKSDEFIIDDHYNNEIAEHEAIRALCDQIGLKYNEVKLSSDYAIDTNLLLDLLNRNEDIHFQNTKNNANISERLEWQTMLQSVLTGDVVTGEKTRLVRPLNEDSENFLKESFKEDLWLGIRAKLFGRTLEEQKRLVLIHRGVKVDEILDEIMNFTLELPQYLIDSHSYVAKVKYAQEKVNELLDKHESCQELWRTHQEMINDKPICATPEFISRINCLVAWVSVTDAIERESDVLKKWVGNDNLDILQPHYSMPNSSSAGVDTIISSPSNEDNIFTDDRSFVERIMKEKDIENLFKKRLFSTFNHWTVKAKNSYIEYHYYFEQLKLPSFLDNTFVLTNFPSKLMREIINARLAFAQKLKNPTMMMIDQLLEDLKMYTHLAIEIRTSLLAYYAPVDGWSHVSDQKDSGFDKALLDSMHYYLVMLNKKLLYSPKGYKTFRTFKEPDELEREWSFLQNSGFYLEGAGIEIATQFTGLLAKLVTRLSYYAHNQIMGPPSDGNRLEKQNLVRWYATTMENYGQLRRKFLRFFLLLRQYFENYLTFSMIPSRIKRFFTLLKETNHTLYHSSKLAEDGVYVFVSESLVNRPLEVQAILNAKYLGVDFSKIPQRHLSLLQEQSPIMDYFRHPYDEDSDDSHHEWCDDYIIVLVPPKALMWDGNVVSSSIDHLLIGDLERGKGMILSNSGPNINIEKCFRTFKDCVGDSVGNITHKGCFITPVEREMQNIEKLFLKLSYFQMDSVVTVRNQCRGVGDCQELVQTVFLFGRDQGRDTLRNLREQNKRGGVILKFINIAVEWLSFIVDDCAPDDPRTFRWCVLALEFAMDVTKGFNILVLDAENFYRFKDKVAGCMALLISHFDIMGARAKARQRTTLLDADIITYQDMHQIDIKNLLALKTHMMEEITHIENERRELQVEQQSVGRVLDNTDMENQLLTYLASSFSSVSIRWQKGKFLGGGTFGSVYASINLDTGGPMAVKEIRFADRQSIKTIVPAIKGEMSVLEMLSHPNIVQFFGVEVHRDRVYIFMEYCSGGSLAGLLEYGRIEDEAVIQLYTLQMLEALAYLHQFGIVHRDVKPDNILLDHMGVIKFVDFGSAKVIPIDNKVHGESSSSSIITLGSVGNNSSGSNSTSAPNSIIGTLNDKDGFSISVPGPLSSTQSSTGSVYGAESVNDPIHDTDIHNPVESRKHALTGTPMYMSPETIKGETTGRFGALDVWSLGCCVLEMATGRRPWSNLDNEFAVMYHIAAGHLPQFPTNYELSKQGQEFLAKCLTIDANKRATAVELLQDPWIQAIREEAFADYGE